ncbi:MAG: DUF418 domain-containing protein [Sphingomonas bacterium]|nr:DUF418 domain-containing protein [Sphingomonas bacterium]
MIAPLPVPTRIQSLDVTRGVAVMGIFSVNVVGMAMIQQAYFYPPAFGFETLADRLMWLGNFLLIDGKLRALFSIMFGASLMLVIERAVAAGRSGWRTHVARMIVLMGFGLLHWAMLWWGDILTHYAAVGLLAALFARVKARPLFVIAAAGLVVHAGLSAFFEGRGIVEYEQMVDRIDAGTATPKMIAEVKEARQSDAPAAAIAKDKAAHRDIASHFAWAKQQGIAAPFDLGPLWLETLPLMLLGMAGFKGGFLTGQWQRRRYRKVAVVAIGVSLVAYAALAALVLAKDFLAPYFFAVNFGFAPLFRPIAAMGYAALIILLATPGGALTTRFAAVGRTAFSNYLGCTFIGTLLFFGFAGNLYATLSRFEAWLFVVPVWALMLLWSKWWLERFNYGPFEWAWRSLARWQLQPLRRVPPPGQGGVGGGSNLSSETAE